MIVLNRGDDAEVTLPEGQWKRRIDTSSEDIRLDGAVEQGRVGLGWQSVVVFERA